MSGAPGTDADLLPEFLTRLGEAYLACGEQTAEVEGLLRRAAAARGLVRARVSAFPTVLLLAVHDGQQERVTLGEGLARTLRLDQVAEVYDLGEEAERGEVEPREGLDRLAAILRREPRFGAVGQVVGHTVMTVGLAVVLMPALTNLAAAAVLGFVVGLLKTFNRDRPVLAVPLSVVAAGVVAALAFLGVKCGLPVDPVHALVPPLVSFLPGAMLTMAMVELAYGDMVSGAGRLTTGFVQLVLLAFGLAAGARLVGYAPEHLVEGSSAPEPGWLAWAGVMVFGLGVFLHFSAPRKSLGWLLGVLLVAFAAQQAAVPLVGAGASGFFGMLVATPLGYVIQHRLGGPPAMVTFLPSFWLLVPGALGLVSVKQMLSDRAAGLDGLVTAVFVFASIALGTLMGASLYRWASKHLGWAPSQRGEGPPAAR